MALKYAYMTKMEEFCLEIDGKLSKHTIESESFALEQAKAIAVMKSYKKVVVYKLVHVPLYEVTSKIKGTGGSTDPSPDVATVKKLGADAGNRTQ